MKILIIFFLVLAGFTVYSQKTEILKSHFTDKLSFGISFSPGISYRSLKAVSQVYKTEDSSNYPDDMKKFRDFDERPNFSYESGISIYYTLSKKLELETGVNYFDKSYTVPTGFNIWGQLGFGEPNPYAYQNAKIKYHFRYLDIPLKITYKINTKNIDIVAGAGLSFEIMSDATETYFYSSYLYDSEGWQQGKKETVNLIDANYSKYNLSPFAYAGIRIAASKHFDIQIAPEFYYGMLNIIKHTDGDHAKEYLWSGNLNLSLIYKP